jgi:phosphate starvation-inducible PhoH-like protein
VNSSTTADHSSSTADEAADANTDGSPALVIEFEDNQMLTALFGEFDSNLARIEQKIGVVLTPRGNRVAISGEATARELARDVLEQLQTRLKRGLEVGPGDVDGAIRIAEQSHGDDVPASERALDDVIIRTRKRVITPRTRIQAHYIRLLQERDMVFALGPAGTGKTYLAAAMAVSMMLSGQVDRIILSRPAVEAGERLGFLPGDMREKVDPYLRPLYDALYDMLPADRVAKQLENGEIEIAPLAFMRGRTLSNAFIILDEAQNTSPVQMKMLLTRLGENSRMVVTGDLSQIDLPKGTHSGLRDAVDTLRGIDDIAVVRFTDADVVRHGLVTRIVQAYDRRDKKAHEDRE